MTKFEESIYANLKAELNMALAAKPTEAIIKRIEYLMAEMKMLRSIEHGNISRPKPPF